MSSRKILPASILNRVCISARNSSYDWILTVPLLNCAVPRYVSRPLNTLTLRLLHTTFHGTVWSSYTNRPLRAIMERAVVVNFQIGSPFFSFGFGVIRGKLCLPG